VLVVGVAGGALALADCGLSDEGGCEGCVDSAAPDGAVPDVMLCADCGDIDASSSPDTGSAGDAAKEAAHEAGHDAGDSGRMAESGPAEAGRPDAACTMNCSAGAPCKSVGGPPGQCASGLCLGSGQCACNDGSQCPPGQGCGSGLACGMSCNVGLDCNGACCNNLQCVPVGSMTGCLPGQSCKEDGKSGNYMCQ
jgi:hypothetical protein